MPSRRRRARTLALQTLYEADTVGHPVDTILEHLTASLHLKDEKAQREIVSFAEELVQGVLEHRERIDDIIARAAPAWPVEQLAVIDRNILRLAILEVLINNKTPVRAAINEAVELGKTFGSDSSARFINGVLGQVSTMAAGRSE
jgi:N utilization substance protein B